MIRFIGTDITIGGGAGTAIIIGGGDGIGIIIGGGDGITIIIAGGGIITAGGGKEAALAVWQRWRASSGAAPCLGETCLMVTTTKKAFLQSMFDGGTSENAPASTDGARPSAIRVPMEYGSFRDQDYYYLTKEVGWKPEGEQTKKFKRIVAPVGFVTDLASIPQIVHSILPKGGRYTHAAVIHDFLYWTQDEPREIADELLKIDMQEFDVEGWKVVAIYRGVRIFGQSAWKNNDRLKRQGEKRILKKLPDSPDVRWEDWKKLPDVFA